MPTWGWILLVIGALIVGGGIAWLAVTRRRTEHLREQFGPEYNRVVSRTDDRREAERELAAREARREKLEIKPLSQTSRTRYIEEWRSVQAEFVDDPGGAVARADSLLQKVMEERGYPVEKFDQRAADLSVDHPKVVENYREGHRLATPEADGGARTEDLRQAMRHFRALFEELVESAPERQVA
jgi:hypothetical protein